MRAVFLAFLAAVLPMAVWAAPAADAITGIWLNSEKTGYIQVYQTESGDYAGQVVGATDGEVRDDTENSDPAKRDQSLLGQQIMHGFTWNGEDGWKEGRVYDPDNGKTYDGWIALKGPDKMELHGYIWFSLIGRSEIWTRVEGMPENVVQKVLVASPKNPDERK
ncbi:MAG: DUF2147 domain-containing protein [Salinisphaera sp.]|nr:DUF2147 domain-containing protein [Salinisphaera sp.]